MPHLSSVHGYARPQNNAKSLMRVSPASCKLMLPLHLKTSSTSCSISAYPIAGIYSSRTAMAKHDGHANLPIIDLSPLASALHVGISLSSVQGYASSG